MSTLIIFFAMISFEFWNYRRNPLNFIITFCIFCFYFNTFYWSYLYFFLFIFFHMWRKIISLDNVFIHLSFLLTDYMLYSILHTIKCEGIFLYLVYNFLVFYILLILGVREFLCNFQLTFN